MDLHNLVLRPNCLLTKYPIVFINGPRSLFFYEKLGGNLQDFVEAHGYKVHCPILAFRNTELRKQGLELWFRQNSSPGYHLVLSEKTKQELESVWQNKPGLSFTFSEDFADENLNTGESIPLNYRLHAWFCRLNLSEALPYRSVFPIKTKPVYDRFLDRCVELAENDWI